MLIDHFASKGEDDAAGRSRTATPMGMGVTLSAAGPGGILGGHPAPAPAAARPEPDGVPDADVEPEPGGARLEHGRSAAGSGSAEGPAPAPEQSLGPVVLGDEGPSGGRSGAGEADPFVALDPGEAAMDRFVLDYLQLLDGRLGAIRHCLDGSDIEGARIAVLSLESSSAMLGAATLAERLTELRSQLDLGSTPERYALLALVESSASAFRSELKSSGRC